MYCDFPSVGRCCFCIPLRQGVLAFGYVNLIYSIFLLGVYSFAVHTGKGLFSLYHGITQMPEGVCVFLYCVEIIFTVILIYGTHQQIVNYIKVYYYFSIMSIVTMPILQLIDLLSSGNDVNPMIMNILELGPLFFAALCINIYLLIAVRSLLRKMEIGNEHQVENPLEQIVFEGQLSDTTRVYNDVVVPESETEKIRI